MTHQPDDPIPFGISSGKGLVNQPRGCDQAQAIHAGSDCEVKKSRIAWPWPQREQQKAHRSSEKDEHAQKNSRRVGSQHLDWYGTIHLPSHSSNAEDFMPFAKERVCSWTKVRSFGIERHLAAHEAVISRTQRSFIAIVDNFSGKFPRARPLVQNSDVLCARIEFARTAFMRYSGRRGICAAAPNNFLSSRRPSVLPFRRERLRDQRQAGFRSPAP